MRAVRDLMGLLVVAALLAVPSVASASQPAGGRWNGSIDGYKEPLHFNVAHNGIVKFDVPTLGCLSFTGYQLETFYIPHTPIHGRSFDGKYHPVKGVTVEIKGKFTSRTAAKGIVHEVYPCDTGNAPWHANRGRYKPVHIKPKVPTCQLTGCLASNGMFIQVTNVDRTLSSPDDPGNVFGTDPSLNGGVEVSIKGTDRSVLGVFDFAPFANFQLRLGSGRVVGNEDSGGATIVGGNGSVYDCTDGDNHKADLTRGASLGPVPVCYSVPNASDRQHLTLYYMPDGLDIDAKIPLG